MIVYTATNTINGKVYVGKTVRTLSHATARHKQRATKAWKNGCESRFYTALRKYGFEAFVFEAVYHGISDEDIQAKEREYIRLLNSMDSAVGYNMTPGGDGGAGKILSEAHRAKLSTHFAGDKNPCHGKFGEKHPAAGHKKSAQGIQNIRNAQSGVPKTDEHRRKLSEARKKLSRWSDKDRADMSELRKSGKTFAQIADIYDSSPGTVFGIIQKYDQSQN
jgi:group I intron endonuclease